MKSPAAPAPLNPTQQYLQRLGDIPDEAYLQSIKAAAASKETPQKTDKPATEPSSAPTETKEAPAAGFVIENSVLTKYIGKEESVVIPPFITRIGTRAFADCTHVKSISLPAALKAIGLHAFDGCVGLSTVSVPDGVTKIADSAFCGCTALTEIHLPDSLTTLGSEAFSRCSSLREICIPAAVSSVALHTFRDCTSLTTVRLPADVSISGYEFEGCSNLKTVYLSRRTKLDKREFLKYHNGVACIYTD